MCVRISIRARSTTSCDKVCQRVAMSQPVAFTAVLAHDVNLGPHQAVEFDMVMTNVGNAYVSKDGQFTAPVYGLYMISATICSLVGFPRVPVSFTNKTDRHDTTEILLEMALNTIKQTKVSNKLHRIYLIKQRSQLNTWIFV